MTDQDLNVFPNARSKILGSDTHAASLTGNNIPSSQSAVTKAQSLFNITDDPFMKFLLTAASIEEEITTQSVTVPADTATEKYIYTASGIVDGFNSGNQGTQKKFLVKLYDDTTVIASATFTWTGLLGADQYEIKGLNATNFSPASGTRNFKLTIENAGSAPSLVGCMIIVNVLKITDDHAASLTGSNTQTSHEQVVLPA